MVADTNCVLSVWDTVESTQVCQWRLNGQVKELVCLPEVLVYSSTDRDGATVMDFGVGVREDAVQSSR